MGVTLVVTSASVNVAATIEVASDDAIESVSESLSTGILASASSLQTALATQGLAVTVECNPPPIRMREAVAYGLPRR